MPQHSNSLDRFNYPFHNTQCSNSLDTLRALCAAETAEEEEEVLS